MRVTALVRTPKKVMIGSLAAVLSLGLAVSTLAPTAGEASSHREAPFTASEPQIDNTDVYAFTSPDNPSTVTLISNWIPFEEPAGGPNFYPFAEKTRYDIKISNDGDAAAEITYGGSSPTTTATRTVSSSTTRARSARWKTPT